uniref:Clp protease proteolytic subunit n=1 Tax=Leontynka pallida TaxID=2912034 RepID=UPI002027FA5D|nr:Clp protease proteolytic subunit [Leontynka pallida]UPQ43851.1 Clp protease proteolytic subunit [Leontynka pallida]
MPIGVPRIIYCWGEEQSAQWTDIYNFIFRRRMVFLMAFLDDDLTNQICGLLINIHMEDRGKEMEKKDMETSKMFKNPAKSNTGKNATPPPSNAFYQDLLKADSDIGVNDNYLLEQKTLQKISMDWLNWNSQFVDYKFGTSPNAASNDSFGQQDNPYFFYLAEILAKDFNNKDAQFFYNFMENCAKDPGNNTTTSKSNLEDVYSPFRLLSNLSSNSNIALTKLNESLQNNKSNLFSKEFLQQFKQFYTKTTGTSKTNNAKADSALAYNLLNLENQKFSDVKAKQLLAQRQLKREYTSPQNKKLLNYLSTDPINSYDIFNSSNDFSKKDKAVNSYAVNSQLSQAYQEEEAKKVFMVINSFGGSVGNGITIFDALQFIKAGSMTLNLGIAASAASLVLAGGTIGERFATEGSHTMLHQTEGQISGQASDIWIDSLEIMKIRMDVAEIYSLATYRPRHKILRDLDRDFYLSATEAIQYGICDEIATNEVMHEIIELTSKVWDTHDTKQQRLLESREGANSDLGTQAQN